MSYSLERRRFLGDSTPLRLARWALALSPFFVQAQDRAAFDVVDLKAPLPLEKLASQLAGKRVIFIGESHERYDHHLNQLEILRRLHELDPNLTLGVEYFQQPFQQQVDGYIAGKTTEQEFLRATEYYQRWGYDYRLYAPIFRFAREQHIPVRALNVPNTLVSAVGKNGISSLSKEQRAYLPEKIEPADEGYKSRLRSAFERHGTSKPGEFDHFIEAQLSWDEGMATSAAAYLKANPDRRMVILAGSGHIEFGSGIPSRLERQIHSPYAIVLNGADEMEPKVADFVLVTAKQQLPPAGTLGVRLQEKGDQCRIESLTPGSPAEKAHLKRGEVLLEIDSQPIKKIADMRLALWDKKPGDRVQVKLHGRVAEITLAAGSGR